MFSDEADRVRVGLFRRVNWLRNELQAAGLDTGDSITQIIPVMVGEAVTALSWSQKLQEDGILAVAIRPPTVPRGSARLRISLNAAHTDADVERLRNAIIRVANG